MSESIINSIDVSECEYINCCSKKAKCIILQDDILSDSQYCESEPNCYFKQLARLQEENEELKKQLEFSRTHKTVLDAERIKYKQALEEIRKEITPVCTYCNNIDGFTTWDDCENVCKNGVIKYLKIIDEVLNEK